MSQNWLWAIWGIVAVVCFLVAIGFISYFSGLDGAEPDEVGAGVVFSLIGSALWPAVMVIGPFIGMCVKLHNMGKKQAQEQKVA